jgi:hypothetical protein
MASNIQIIRLELLIKREWEKPCNNASDAHFRACRLTSLQNRLNKLQNGHQS